MDQIFLFSFLNTLMLYRIDWFELNIGCSGDGTIHFVGLDSPALHTIDWLCCSLFVGTDYSQDFPAIAQTMLDSIIERAVLRLIF